MSSKLKSEKSIKAKVFAGFGLFIVLIFSISYIALKSFNNLTSSADKLAEPNKNIILLHDIIFSIYQAESHIRNYTLTLSEDYLNLYFEELENIDFLVDTLYHLSATDIYFSEKTDSINLLLNQKIALLEQLIDLKSSDRNSVFYEMAINKIIKVTDEQTTDEGQEIVIPIRAPEVTDNENDLSGSLPEEEVTEPVTEKRGFFRRVRDLFTGDRAPAEEPEPVVEEQIAEIPPDSIVIELKSTFNKEDLKYDIESILSSVKRLAIRYHREISEKENQILLEDKLIMDRIWAVVTLLENYESQKAIRQAHDSHDTVKSSTNTILIILLLCFLILIVFSWMVSYDVARSRFYKKQLLAQKERAENLVRIKQRFMANMSHEVRTPLSAIIGFTNQIQRTRLNNEQQFFSEAIRKSSHHLLGIVNDILDFSKIEAGKLVLENIPIDINELVRDVHRTLDILAQEKSLDFTLNFEGLTDPYVYGDPLRIRQILINLTGNALKFTDSGYVKVIVFNPENEDDEDNARLCFVIEDSGPGIEPEKQKEIFEEFAQGGSQTSRKHGGTGLGLSISAKLIEMMKGTIELYSEPGNGSTFVVNFTLRKVTDPVIDKKHGTLKSEEILKSAGSLPVFSNDQPHADMAHIERMHHDQMGYKVLLVEDKSTNQMVISMMLRELGCEVDLASNGKIALEKITPGKYDLVFLDIQMPVMDGNATLAELKRKYNQEDMPYIIGLSGNAMKGDAEYYVANGMDDYITKPVNYDTLKSCLEKWEAIARTNKI